MSFQMGTNYYKKIVFVVNTLLLQTIGRLGVPRCASYGMRYLIIGRTARVSILSNSVIPLLWTRAIFFRTFLSYKNITQSKIECLK